MREKDIRRQIRLLWAIRDRKKNTILDIFGFYTELQKDHPELLEFKYRGDKYQTVRAWLSDSIIE
jgi:hypothetical protein